MADDQPNKVRNPINIFMKEGTSNIIAENDPIGDVITGLTSLEKALKTNRKDGDKTTDRLIGYVESHLKEARGLQRASQDPQFRKQPGSYRFFSETADKLTTTLGKTVGSVTGKVSDDILKSTKKAYDIVDVINRIVRGVPKRDLEGVNKDYYRERYDFEEKHMKLIIKNSENLSNEDLSEIYKRIRRDKASTARGVQQNRNVGAERGNLGVEKADRTQGELNQVLFREKYIDGVEGGGSTVRPGGDGKTPDDEGSPPIIEPPVIEPPDPVPLVIEPPEPEDFFDFDEVLNKVSITAKDVANALAKEIRRDLIREALEKTDYMMEKRERERKEKEKVVAEKMEAARLKRKRANEHKMLMDYRDMLNKSGSQFLKDEEARRKAEAEAQEKYGESKKELYMAVGSIIAKTLKNAFDKFFNRTASDVSNSITGFMDDPIMALINQTEYGVNAVADIITNASAGMIGVGMGIMNMGDSVMGLLGGGDNSDKDDSGGGAGGIIDGISDDGSKVDGIVKELGLTKIGAIVAGVNPVITVITKVVQGVLNAGLGIFKAIYTKMSESSPVLQGFAKMFKTAVNLIFMPIGNIMGTFFMAFGMHMINFAVWFNREFPKYKYAVIGYMTLGIGSITHMMAYFATIFSALLKVLGYGFLNYDITRGLGQTLISTGNIISKMQTPLFQLSESFYGVSEASFKLHDGIQDGIEDLDNLQTDFNTQLNLVNTNLENIFNELREGVNEEMSKPPAPVNKTPLLTLGKLFAGFARRVVAPNPITDPNSHHGIQTFAHGGYIPPKPGGTVIRVAEGTRGEWITPVGMGVSREGGVNIIIEIKGNIYGDEALKRTIERSVNDALMRSNVL